MTEISKEELIEALKRANELIVWFMQCIGQTVPGEYQKCYYDLNEHFIFIERLKYEERCKNESNS